MTNLEALDRAIQDKQIKKILILQLGGIGDLELSIPALEALRDKFKEAYISLLVIPRSAELIRGLAYIDSFFILEIYYTNLIYLLKWKALMKIFKAIKDLRQEKFDLAINLENISSLKGAIKMLFLFWLIGAKFWVGRDTDGRGFFFHLKIKEEGHAQRHEIEANLDVARALGADAKQIKLELPIFQEDKVFISDFLIKNNISDQDLAIGLNPGAFNLTRRWFEPCWAALADQLVENYNCKIIITAQDSERQMINTILSLTIKKQIIAVTNLTLKQLAVLIKRFNLFITNDSGPMHIAAASSTPIIALFGPGDIYKFSPYCSRDRYQIIRKEVDCKRPCYASSCRSHQCMRLITVEDILEAVKKVLR